MDARALIEERVRAVEENRALLDSVDGTKKKGLTSEEKESFDKRDARISEIRGLLDQQAKLDAEERELGESRGRQTRTSVGGSDDEARSAYRRDLDLAFRGWTLGRHATPEMRAAAERVGVRVDSSYIDMVTRKRTQDDGTEVREFLPVVTDPHGNIREFRAHPESRSLPEIRALSSGTTTAGGDSIPTAMMVKYTEVQKWYAAIAQKADVLNTENGQSIPWPTVTDTANSGRILGEGTTATTTTDPTFSKVTLGAWKISSDAVVVPWELQMDSFMDLAAWLGKQLGIRIGRKKNNEFTVGVGTTEPKGLIAGCAIGVTAVLTNGFTMDETITLEHSVDPAYRSMPDTGFMMHDTIAAYIRTLKDGVGRYLWEPSLQAGQPDRFRGYPTTINNDMASALTTGLKLLGFGNINAAFVVRNAGTARFIRDESIYVKEHLTYFEALERCDSNVVDSTAFKVLKLA